MRAIFAIFVLVGALFGEDLPITGISHVAFRVSDIRQALDFYSGILGLPEAFTLGNTHFMKVNDEQYLEVQLGAPAEGNLRMTHIALVTSSVEKLHAILVERGLTPAPLKQTGTDGNRSFRLIDPDGNILEFTEYQPGSLHSNARGKLLDAPRISSHLQHGGFPVGNLDLAVAWYRNKLGFVSEFPGQTVAYMRMPGLSGDTIELIAQPGTGQHAGFTVRDLRVAYDSMVLCGGKPLPDGLASVWLHDPDGSGIELIESHVARR